MKPLLNLSTNPEVWGALGDWLGPLSPQVSFTEGQFWRMKGCTEKEEYIHVMSQVSMLMEEPLGDEGEKSGEGKGLILFTDKKAHSGVSAYAQPSLLGNCVSPDL